MKAILFGNDGCGSCRKWKPLFIKLMNMFNIGYEQWNLYDPSCKPLKDKYNVCGIPYTVFTDDEGNEIGNILGSMDEEIAIRQIQHYIENGTTGDRL